MLLSLRVHNTREVLIMTMVRYGKSDFSIHGKTVDAVRILREEGISQSQLEQAFLYNGPIPDVASLADAQNRYNDTAVAPGSDEAHALIRAIAQYYVVGESGPTKAYWKIDTGRGSERDLLLAHAQIRRIKEAGGPSNATAILDMKARNEAKHQKP